MVHLFAVLLALAVSTVYGATNCGSNPDTPVPQTVDFVSIEDRSGTRTPTAIFQRYEKCVAFSNGGMISYAPTTCVGGTYIVKTSDIKVDPYQNLCGNNMPPAVCGKVASYPPLPCNSGPWPPKGLPAGSVIPLIQGPYTTTVTTLQHSYCQCVAFRLNTKTVFAPLRYENGAYKVNFDDLFRDCTVNGTPIIEGIEGVSKYDSTKPPSFCNTLYHRGQTIRP
ncbi:hypothetical protein BDR26DRAFT_868432 [Obelidium mucronatum]|nr:hypothetical protein BDR26DRAFT_868432 [Obelidium mucronatum]